MKRGDGVIVAAAGDYGKARPAIVIQTNAFPETHPSVVICQMTSDIVDAPDFRVTIDPNQENSLRVHSQVMADKPVTVRRERIVQLIGRLSDSDIGRLNIALAVVMGLAD
jgi:mRNA interferase MazF